MIGELVEARFTPDAVGAYRQLMRRLNELVEFIGVPEPPRGIVEKLVQHAVKLALLHRCFRWGAGEFGEHGPLGDIDAADAAVACEGRAILPRPLADLAARVAGRRCCAQRRGCRSGRITRR